VTLVHQSTHQSNLSILGLRTNQLSILSTLVNMRENRCRSAGSTPKVHKMSKLSVI